MTVAYYLVAILGLAVLMIVHESGHYFAARHFGMRVVRFSVGFGPTLWKRRPKNSPTVYQVALIPFLAYVQIAGMNPYEDIDPKDEGSYANASLWGRIVTIAAGPLTNYLFASVLIFFGLIVGRVVPDGLSMKVVVEPGPAMSAGIETGDKIDAVDGVPVKDWTELRKSVGAHPGEAVDVTIERNGETLHKSVTPSPKGSDDEGLIHVRQPNREVGLKEALVICVVAPPELVYENLRAIGRVIIGKEKLQMSGPVGIVKETAKQAQASAGALLQTLGMLSAYLGAFNLLPIPALDGGRLLFLLAEAVSRRKLDAKLEARVHAVGLLIMLTLIAFVTYGDVISK
jgi:regulator of sigma E protease